MNQKICQTRKMFIMYLSSTEQAQSAFLGVINLKGKMDTEIMDVIFKLFTAKSLRIKKM